MRRKQQRSEREPTIALINIVFLMLIFFLVAGTLARPLDKDLALVNTTDLDSTAPPDALIAHADGRLTYRGKDVASAAAFWASYSAEATTGAGAGAGTGAGPATGPGGPESGTLLSAPGNTPDNTLGNGPDTAPTAPDIRVIPDRNLPANDLVALGRALQQAGAGKVIIVTEKALQ